MIGKFFALAKAVKKIKPRIKPGKAFFFIFFALAVDLVQMAVELLDLLFGLGYVINLLIDITMGFTLYLLFRFEGIKFIQVSGVKKSNATGLIAFLITLIIKIIPILDMLPAWTVDTVINIAVSWVEDLAAQEESGTLAKILPGGRQALSQGAKKQALQTRQQDRIGRAGRYGPNGEEKNPEREKLAKSLGGFRNEYEKLSNNNEQGNYHSFYDSPPEDHEQASAQKKIETAPTNTLNLKNRNEPGNTA